jgi:GT2 family glycosyltransferase
VIVTWNARDDVLRCLTSLAENVRVPHEAIVVDDGSTDGTPDEIRERFPDARLVVKPVNEGLVAGRNAALPLVRGRIVLMLDADTVVRPGAVETLAGVLDSQPGVGLVGPKLIGPEGELQLSCRRYPPLLIPFMRRGPYARLNPDPPAHRRHLMKDYDHSAQRPVVWVSGAVQMWRADLPSRIGPYDRLVSSYGGEDLDWCLRVWAAGLEVHYVPEAEIVHVWQQMTRRNLYGRKSFRALRDWYYLQWKHRRLRRSPRLVEANR